MAHSDKVSTSNASTQTEECGPTQTTLASYCRNSAVKPEDVTTIVSPQPAKPAHSKEDPSMNKKVLKHDDDDVPMEDLVAMAKIRAAIATQHNPRSVPDIMVQDNENALDLKKYVLKGWKKKIFQSEC